MSVLEKIRAEIQSNFEDSTKPNYIDAMMRNIGREECLEIIDKYAEQDNRVRANVPRRLTKNVGNGLKMSDGVGDYPTDIEYDKYAEQEQTDEWQNGYDRAWELAEVFYEQEPCDKCEVGNPCLYCKHEFEQESKTGHWIKKDGYSDCSECGSHIVTEWDYCPKCGCRMVEPQESEKISERNMKMWEEIFKAESEDKE